jgi:glyoxylase-like metal-dependent hydrolase (beta-lactamase superfamily II)/rhodanese-related sulfurtransferase
MTFASSRRRGHRAPSEGPSVRIVPFVDEGLGNSSYLVDLGDGRGLVVDPTRDVAPYVSFAEAHSLRLAFSLETHLHADFVSGSRELARLGATVLAPREGRSAFPHRGLDDEEEVDVGGLTLRAIGTPGHTPEHLAYLLLDRSRQIGLFSGGALLVGSVARTDLISADQTEPLARALYRALRSRILTLPDELPVYPTHGAGSFCSAPGGGERMTTIGRERATNVPLGAPDEETFVRRLTAGLGTYPDYFLRLREVNRRGPTVYGDRSPILRSLTPAQLDAAVRDGAELIDVRPIEAFAAGHVPGALSIALRASFASWLGWLVAADRPLVFVLADEQDRGELIRQCLKIGYESFAGELAGGMTAWREDGHPEARTELVRDPAALHGPLIDVRQSAEYTTGHVPGAALVELGSLAPQAGDLASGTATVMCAHGERATTAASLLERAGGTPSVFVGGSRRWSRALGKPLATET